jgi:hypothetical protein
MLERESEIPDDVEDEIEMINECLDLLGRWSNRGMPKVRMLRLAMNALAAFMQNSFIEDIKEVFVKESERAISRQKKISSLEEYNEEES